MKNISLKLIFRSWWRNKAFAVISVLSLAVGIACTNLLAAFVIHEYNVEAGNPNRDRIVVAKHTEVESGRSFAHRYEDVTESLVSHVPELEKGFVARKFSNISYCKIGENFYNEEFMTFVSDSLFLQFFPQKVLMGSLEDALSGPDKIVLTESFSKQLFGQKNPIGQTIQLQYLPVNFREKKWEGLIPLTVSAIIKDNKQGALIFDAIIFDKPIAGTHFFLLKDNISIANLQAKTNNLVLENSKGLSVRYSFLGIQETSLSSEDYYSDIKRPDKNLLFIAFFSAILILAIACFNYVNLSFSRVFKQLYSIHIQKLMGAGSGQLAMQLFADTFMTVGLGFLIAQLIQYDLLLVTNRIMLVQIPASFLYSNQVLPVTLLFILILALVPAFYMSRRLPNMSISVYNNFYRGKAKQRIIGSLAILQFVISLVLLIGSFSVRQQLTLLYEKTEDYKNIYTFAASDFKTSMLPLKERVAHFPGIQAIASGNSSLSGGSTTGYTKNGEEIYVTLDEGDEGMMKSMRYKIIQGLSWEEAIEEYPNPTYLNRTWARRLFPNGEVPIGYLIKDYEPALEEHALLNNKTIAGVVEDYFRGYLERPVHEAIISYNRNGGVFLVVRTEPKQTDKVIKHIHEEWNKLYPGQYLEHYSEYNTILSINKKLFGMFDLLMMYSIISILLTCFGLFGMALYAIEQRTKEIGIRKVNGSTTWQIMMMLNQQFIGWIGIAYVIGVPVAYWLSSRWTQNFAYRTSFSIWTYILPLLIVVGITLLTVSWHSYRAATGNPVNALRDE
ncbi:putative ABC transport system permease protein [Parabacteroides sp. PF5-5]|uniref:ABC transporter permease n=1 Tax=unclassified Parabacteroides TaxID=2649774 RepID=UPI002476BFF1|nr:MULTISPECIES: FtsX-like permease family protein [unclassified Parabacteroides]MDH6304543.1 putative ABC transport system permease protein [Parabacteroides sp. PH5-39]MDH6315305.1 putative ABC transport system permease protein [Parabacteroides sp. PF5-13]MDH6319201.1 putative ABC transport system permease protein [Parabacteroides sp. PH5-13]MDH6322932.1 putative ABC transport system permease protein [Parabacteroides sp. PH5-8]MDH6326496.1 putative ABC transport system permease protein [Parab